MSNGKREDEVMEVDMEDEMDIDSDEEPVPGRGLQVSGSVARTVDSSGVRQTFPPLYT